MDEDLQRRERVLVRLIMKANQLKKQRLALEGKSLDKNAILCDTSNYEGLNSEIGKVSFRE